MRPEKPRDEEELELIDPSEMSQLRVIAYLKSRGSGEYAEQVARAISSKPASEVANVLIKKGRPSTNKVADLAQRLKDSVAIPPQSPGRPR